MNSFAVVLQCRLPDLAHSDVTKLSCHVSVFLSVALRGEVEVVMRLITAAIHFVL